MASFDNTHFGKHYEITAISWLPKSNPKKIHMQKYRHLFSDLPKQDGENAFDLFMLIHDLLGDMFGARYSAAAFRFEDLVGYINSIWMHIDEDDHSLYMLLKTHFHFLVEKNLIKELFLPN